MTATSAIIPASGRGRRLGKPYNKVFLPLAGMPMLARTLAVFQACEEIEEIVLVVNEDETCRASDLVSDYCFSKVAAIAPGGESRQDSVRNGLSRISPTSEIVAIHDAARPLVTPDIIVSSIQAAREFGAAVAAVPAVNTIKSSGDGRFVDETLDRGRLYAVQTPQAFDRSLIESAYERASADDYVGTDDASLVERIGRTVAIVQGSCENIKVTSPPDVATAEAVLEARGEIVRAEIRVGHGCDVHRFSPGRKLFLGGVAFPGEDGLLGHSDADVLVHAVMDALLGAAGMPDIGRLFPDTHASYKGIRSTQLLRRVAERIADAGWLVGNVDATLIAERPRIAARVEDMRRAVAEALGITPSQVGIKATTAEGLGRIGEGLGIECHAIALLRRP